MNRHLRYARDARRDRRDSGAVSRHRQSPGADGTYLIKGGTVVTGTGEKLANTSILIRNGRIAQLGPNVSANDAKVIDATGKFVYPGMIDS